MYIPYLHPSMITMITMKRKKFKPLAPRLRNNKALPENLYSENYNSAKSSSKSAGETSTFCTQKRRFTRRNH